LSSVNQQASTSLNGLALDHPDLSRLATRVLLAIKLSEMDANEDEDKRQHDRADEPGDEHAALPGLAQNYVALTHVACGVNGPSFVFRLAVCHAGTSPVKLHRR
jgi:hypothetical protein